MAIIYGDKYSSDHELIHILEGTPEDDEFYGSGANEVLRGNGGNDYFEGGSGYDIIELWGDSGLAGSGLGSGLKVTVTDDEVIISGTKDDGMPLDEALHIGDGIEEIRFGGSDKDDTFVATDVTKMRIVIEAYDGDDYIAGGSFDDGESLDDVLSGNGGNDILAGNGGDDALFGGSGNDQLYGGQGNDFLYGDGTANGIGYAPDDRSPESVLQYSYQDIESTPDSYWEQSHQEPGNNFDDFLAGNEGDDYLNGGEGNDTLLGGTDKDVLVGGSGDDYLLGTDPSSPHQGEVDTLTGGLGSDQFLLGNIYTSFYISGNDFAVITDLETTVDTVQLYGGANQYFLGLSSVNINGVNGTGLYRLTGGNGSNQELIAIFENTWGLNLNDSYFDYV